MKSLQVLTPARECIFNCPFCIAKTHVHQNNFINNYDNDYSTWRNNFVNILENNDDLKNIVITGTNEPLQDEECIRSIVSITRKIKPDINIELQTRFYHYKEALDIVDVVAFSIGDFYFLDKIDIINKRTRYVIILTDSFNNKTLDDILKRIPLNVLELTFKTLHDSHGYNTKIDTWIEQHKVDIDTIIRLRNEINNYKGPMSIYLDESCMKARNRYMVFRENGLLYEDFDSIEEVKNYQKRKK